MTPSHVEPAPIVGMGNPNNHFRYLCPPINVDELLGISAAYGANFQVGGQDALGLLENIHGMSSSRLSRRAAGVACRARQGGARAVGHQRPWCHCLSVRHRPYAEAGDTLEVSEDH